MQREVTLYPKSRHGFQSFYNISVIIIFDTSLQLIGKFELLYNIVHMSLKYQHIGIYLLFLCKVFKIQNAYGSNVTSNGIYNFSFYWSNTD